MNLHYSDILKAPFIKPRKLTISYPPGDEKQQQKKKKKQQKKKKKDQASVNSEVKYKNAIRFESQTKMHFMRIFII